MKEFKEKLTELFEEGDYDLIPCSQLVEKEYFDHCVSSIQSNYHLFSESELPKYEDSYELDFDDLEGYTVFCNGKDIVSVCSYIWVNPENEMVSLNSSYSKEEFLGHLKHHLRG